MTRPETRWPRSSTSTHSPTPGPSRRVTDVRIERFTQRAQEAITEAQQLAEAEGNPQLDVLHLMLVLTEQSDGVVPAVLERIGKDAAHFAQALRGELANLPKVQGSGTQLTLSDEARRALS